MTKRATTGRKLTGIYSRGKTFWFTFRLNGKKHFRSLGTSDYGEAVKKALEIRQTPELASAAVFAAEIKAFIDHKVARNEYSPDSAAVKVHILEELAETTGKPNPTSVTTADVTKLYRLLQARVAESTAQGYLVTVRSFYNWLVAASKMRSNPVVGVALDKLDLKGRDKFCSPVLRDKLIAECPEDRDDLRLVLFLGFHAGLRKREITEARPEWFDLDRGLLTVQKTATFRPKDREARTIPLTAAFRSFLARYGLPTPFVLHPEVKHKVPKPGKKPNRYRYDFRKPFDVHVEAQCCPWVTPHVMRHTFASLLASAGVSIYKIATWLGDDVRVVQKHYAKLTPDDGDIEKAFG